MSRRSRKRRQNNHHSRGLKIFLLLLGLPLVFGSLGGSAVAYHYYQRLHSCSLNGLSPITFGENSRIYASDGSLLGIIPSQYNHIPLTLKQMSPWVYKSTVAIEDRRFFSHGAVDYRAIARAALKDLLSGKKSEGASTITQQLVRNLYPGLGGKTINRKIKEACLAGKLSGRWSKNHILEAYLNQIYYGERAYGIGAAARTYFNKSAHNLTLSQAALLAGLAQAPSAYNPFLHPQLALNRRAEVLQALYDTNIINSSQFTRASKARLNLQRGYFSHPIKQTTIFDYVYSQLIGRYGIDTVQRGGLRVYTTIDPRLQATAVGVARGILNYSNDPSAGIASVEAKTGNIKAIASWSPKHPKLKFNLAAQAQRQAGSAFKTFTLIDAVNRGIDPNNTDYLSAPFSYLAPGTTKPWVVHTDDYNYYGSESIHDATVHSDNTVFARLTLDLGPQSVADTAHLLGINSALRPVPSISLGTNPVTPLEMASAYATIASGGIYHTPRAISKVLFADGRKSVWYLPPPERVIPYNVAYEVTQILEDNVSYGTGTRAQISGRAIAGKTGTNSDFKDAWFCGYTPQLSTAVWVGYLHGEIPMRSVHGIEVFGGTFPAQIWQGYMTQALASKPALDWKTPRVAISYHYFRGHFQYLNSYP